MTKLVIEAAVDSNGSPGTISLGSYFCLDCDVTESITLTASTVDFGHSPFTTGNNISELYFWEGVTSVTGLDSSSTNLDCSGSGACSCVTGYEKVESTSTTTNLATFACIQSGGGGGGGDGGDTTNTKAGGSLPGGTIAGIVLGILALIGIGVGMGVYFMWWVPKIKAKSAGLSTIAPSAPVQNPIQNSLRGASAKNSNAAVDPTTRL